MAKQPVKNEEKSVYVQLNLYNLDTTQNSGLFNTRLQLSTNIVEYMKDYDIGIADMSTPTQLIPIMIWDDYWYVGLVYNGVLYQSQCLYVDPTNDPTVTALKYVYSLDAVTESFNNAMALCVSALNTAFPGTIAVTPVLTFVPSEGTFQLLVGEDQVNNPSTVQIAVSAQWMSSIFHTFDIYKNTSYSFTSGVTNDYTNIVKCSKSINNRFNGTIEALTLSASGTKYLIKQNAPSYDTTIKINGMRLYAENSQITPENLVAADVNNQNSATKIINTEQLLQEFLFIYSGYDTGKNIYFPKLIKYHDFNGSGPFNQMTLRVRFVTTSNESFPLYIPYGYSVSLKLELRRKVHAIFV